MSSGLLDDSLASWADANENEDEVLAVKVASSAASRQSHPEAAATAPGAPFPAQAAPPAAAPAFLPSQGSTSPKILPPTAPVFVPGQGLGARAPQPSPGASPSGGSSFLQQQGSNGLSVSAPDFTPAAVSGAPSVAAQAPAPAAAAFPLQHSSHPGASSPLSLGSPLVPASTSPPQQQQVQLTAAPPSLATSPAQSAYTAELMRALLKKAEEAAVSLAATDYRVIVRGIPRSMLPLPGKPEGQGQAAMARNFYEAAQDNVGNWFYDRGAPPLEVIFPTVQVSESKKHIISEQEQQSKDGFATYVAIVFFRDAATAAKALELSAERVKGGAALSLEQYFPCRAHGALPGPIGSTSSTQPSPPGAGGGGGAGRAMQQRGSPPSTSPGTGLPLAVGGGSQAEQQQPNRPLGPWAAALQKPTAPGAASQASFGSAAQAAPPPPSAPSLAPAPPFPSSGSGAPPPPPSLFSTAPSLGSSGAESLGTTVGRTWGSAASSATTPPLGLRPLGGAFGSSTSLHSSSSATPLSGSQSPGFGSGGLLGMQQQQHQQQQSRPPMGAYASALASGSEQLHSSIFGSGRPREEAAAAAGAGAAVTAAASSSSSSSSTSSSSTPTNAQPYSMGPGGGGTRGGAARGRSSGAGGGGGPSRGGMGGGRPYYSGGRAGYGEPGGSPAGAEAEGWETADAGKRRWGGKREEGGDEDQGAGQPSSSTSPSTSSAPGALRQFSALQEDED